MNGDFTNFLYFFADFIGLNVAYGLKDNPTNGPFPEAIKVEPLPDPNGRLYVEITYDQPFTWNSTETEGFYVCTISDLTNFCNGGWQKVCLFLYDLKVLVIAIHRLHSALKSEKNRKKFVNLLFTKKICKKVQFDGCTLFASKAKINATPSINYKQLL